MVSVKVIFQSSFEDSPAGWTARRTLLHHLGAGTKKSPHGCLPCILRDGGLS